MASRDIGGSTSSLPAAINSRNQGFTNNAGNNAADQEIFIWKAPPPPYVSRTDLNSAQVDKRNQHTTTGVPRRRTIQGGFDLDKVCIEVSLEANHC